MGLADCCCGPMKYGTERVSDVRQESRRQARSTTSLFPLKCLAITLVGLLVVGQWPSPLESKRVHTNDHPDHSQHDDFEDDHEQDSPDLPAGAARASDDVTSHDENPDHPEAHSAGSAEHPDHPESENEDEDEDEDEHEAESRADLPGLDRAKAKSRTTTTTTKRPTSTSSSLTSSRPKSSSSPSPSRSASSTEKPSEDTTKKIEKEHVNEAAKAAAHATDMAKTASPKRVELDKAIKSMESEAKQVEAKRNKSIIINGRKFDQVNPIECVNDNFYSVLMKDLNLIDPAEAHDEYETYFDRERAMAISAIVDAPVSKQNSAFDRQLELAAGSGGSGAKVVDAAAAASRAASSVLGGDAAAATDEKLDKDMTSEQLIREIKEFWRETNKTYSDTSRELNMKFKRRKRAARKETFESRAAPDGVATGSTPKPEMGTTTTVRSALQTSTTKVMAANVTSPAAAATTPKAASSATTSTSSPPVAPTGKTAPATKPNYKKALENHYYLMSRLEELKAMLLNGEEALIILNNRVKKLQQAVGEDELKRALCSCITSRGGRAALMLMSELFTDKNALDLLDRLDQAKRKAELSAKDTAEFCSYWYGDTLRSQAIIKEKQIKRLIVKIKNDYQKQTTRQVIKNQTTTKTSVKFVKDGNSVKKVTHRETKVRVIIKVVEMTRLWRPELTDWIHSELGPEISRELSIFPNCNPSNRTRPKRRAQVDDGETPMSTPFDQSSLYADLDDGEDFESSAILQSFVASNFGPTLLRGRRGVSSTAKPAAATPTKTTTTTTTTTPTFSATTTSKEGLVNGTTTRPEDVLTGVTPTPGTVSKSTTTGKPAAVGASSTLAPSGAKENNSSASNVTASFEDRVSRSANRCAKDGFAVLLDIAYDQNAILYETSRIKRNSKYIETLRDWFMSSFGKFWVEKRDEWSRKFTANTSNLSLPESGCTNERVSWNASRKVVSSSVSIIRDFTRLKLASSSTTPRPPEIQLQVMMPVAANKSVDDLIDDALEPTGDAYERGARLGFTIGKFIGSKAARQWPDPLELNTFTYDSLFLAGVGDHFDAQQTRLLEDLIVSETAKRVAFTEASRLAFARALHTAYMNGAFLVPKFGVLHGQRAIAKRAATEGAQVGFAAASKAADEFAPAAIKFLSLHEHQRKLAQPYKKASESVSGSNATTTGEGATKKSLLGRIDAVRAESELNANITRTTLDCGYKSGAVMGALVGLLVTPEAFETYARVRGSLEAVEGEFYRYKLGALRGYELGESWAILNYTNAMAKRLDSFRGDIGRTDLVTLPGGAAVKPNTNKPAPATSTVRPLTRTTIRNRVRRRANATHIPDAKFLSTVNDTDPEKTNVNNIFQFMVVNYGQRLVANHTGGSMLTFRTLAALDEATLREMKLQSGDMLETTRGTAAHDNEDIFETVKVTGELMGTLGSLEPNSRKFPLKLEVLDLGPLIEFADAPPNKSHAVVSDLSKPPLQAIPLTEALSRVNKIYVKLRLARRNGSELGSVPASDVLEAYLNNDLTDGGDGFLCGSYSYMGHLDANLTHETQDDLALELAILDELHHRIENLKPGQDAVTATEQLLRVTTAAPSRVTPFGTSTTSPTAAPSATSNSAATTNTITPTTSTSQPASAKGTTPTGAIGTTPTTAAAAAATNPIGASTQKVAVTGKPMTAAADSRSSLDEDSYETDAQNPTEVEPAEASSSSPPASAERLEEE